MVYRETLVEPFFWGLEHLLQPHLGVSVRILIPKGLEDRSWAVVSQGRMDVLTLEVLKVSALLP